MAQWRLKSGIHQDKEATPLFLEPQDGLEDRSLEDWKNKDNRWDFVPPSFHPGDVFESNQNLERFNHLGVAPRFEKLDDSYSELDNLTVVQLRELAEEEEITIPDKIGKGDLIKAIRCSLGYKEAVS